MTIRNWFKFFMTALLIGGGITAIAGVVVRWEFFSTLASEGEYLQFIGAFLWMVFLGFTMSVVAQMGFFAYLTLHQFGLGMFRSHSLWNWVQAVIILFVIFDLIYFRFVRGDQDYVGLYVFWSIVLFGSAIVTTYVKVKWTQKIAMIPTLFLMIAITTLEWLPALMVKAGNIEQWATILLFPLVAVNSYQILVLPKYNKKSEEDTLRREKIRKERAAKEKQQPKKKGKKNK